MPSVPNPCIIISRMTVIWQLGVQIVSTFLGSSFHPFAALIIVQISTVLHICFFNSESLLCTPAVHRLRDSDAGEVTGVGDGGGAGGQGCCHRVGWRISVSGGGGDGAARVDVRVWDYGEGGAMPARSSGV
jgi:hypothetical protein